MATLELRIMFPAISGFLGYMDPDTQKGSEEEMARLYAFKLPKECDQMLRELPILLTNVDFPLNEIQYIYNRNLQSVKDAKSWLLHMAEILKDERSKASQNPA